jgi:peroxiredoxin
MASRPRLLVASLGVALVASVVGGWALGRAMNDDGDVADDIVLDTPGEYQLPADGDAVALTGDRLPSVSLVGADDQPIDSASLVGTPLVVNIWFSTCPPCERELGDFATVQRELGDTVRFVGVNPVDSAGVMASFAAERGVAYELLRDTDGSFVEAVGVVGYPTTLFVDADGVIVDRTGVLDADGLRQRIDEVL